MSVLSTPQALRGNAERGWQLVRKAYDAGLIHLLVSIVFVQGMSYITQLGIAKFVGPADFGIVRSVEAVLSILVLCGSISMPSLAIKSIAEISDPPQRAVLLGRLVTLAVAGGLVVAIAMSQIMPFFITPSARMSFSLLVWMIGITGVARTCINYFQGIKQFQKMAVINMVLSVLSITVLLVLVWLERLTGWLIGRYLGECMLATGALFLVRHRISFKGVLPAEYGYRRLAAMGITITVSMLARVLLDNIGLLTLGALKRGPEELGFYGLGTLLANAALLVPASLASLALPRFAECARDPHALWALYKRVLRIAVVTTFGIAVLLMLASSFLPLVFGARYQPAVAVVRILTVALCFRSLTTFAGTLLLALNKNTLTVIGNTVFLAVGVMLFGTFGRLYGVTGVAWSTAVIELGVMLFYLLAARRMVRRLIGATVR